MLKSIVVYWNLNCMQEPAEQINYLISNIQYLII